MLRSTLLTLALAAAGAGGTAQAASAADEPAAARAFVAATDRADAAVTAATAEAVGPLRTVPECAPEVVDALTRDPLGAGVHVTDGLIEYLAVTILRPLVVLSRELDAVPTDDPILRTGRSAWRRVARAVATIGTLDAADACAALQVAIDPDPLDTPAETAGIALVHTISGGGHARVVADTRRLHRTARRLHQLGIPRNDARAFTGDWLESAVADGLVRLGPLRP